MTKVTWFNHKIRRNLSLAFGLVFALFIYIFIPEITTGADGSIFILSHEGRVTLAMMCLMATWWILAVIPIYVTALIPLLILPITGNQSFYETTASYGHPIIFLALGGFILAAALERWDVHKKFANIILSITGNSPKRLVAGFMLASAILSMWISNTATAILMLPIALSVSHTNEKEKNKIDNFPACLLLGVCYACSIGGMSTLIGTTSNMFFAGYIESEMDHKISFIQWMIFSGPVAIIMLILSWWLLTHWLLPIGPEPSDKKHHSKYIQDSIPWTRNSIATLLVFLFVALSWMFMPLINLIPGLQHLTMYIMAIIGIFLLFIIPSTEKDQGLINWKTVHEKVPWGILLLIGGGLSLAKAFSKFSVTEYLVLQISDMSAFPLLFALMIIITLMVFLTEVTSNVASVTALTPIFAALGLSLGFDPILVVASITLAASCAFMLPIATPPNAVIFGSGRIQISQMIRAGFVLNIIAIIVITLWSYFLGPQLLFGNPN
jgi:sodium-dependent dicarboxylate transporter 2/3/5